MREETLTGRACARQPALRQWWLILAGWRPGRERGRGTGRGLALAQGEGRVQASAPCGKRRADRALHDAASPSAGVLCNGPCVAKGRRLAAPRFAMAALLPTAVTFAGRVFGQRIPATVVEG